MSTEVKIILRALAAHGRKGIEQILPSIPYDTLILTVKHMTAQGWVDSIITDMADGSELLEYCVITKEGMDYLALLESSKSAKALHWLKHNKEWFVGIVVTILLWLMDKIYSRFFG